MIGNPACGQPGRPFTEVAWLMSTTPSVARAAGANTSRAKNNRGPRKRLIIVISFSPCGAALFLCLIYAGISDLPLDEAVVPSLLINWKILPVFYTGLPPSG